MAKIYGLFGAMTGKLADTVMSVRNGEQIARKYQPVVFNPSTPAQVAQRAKLKLLSQLSAVMAPVIAIQRQGSVSSRNLFTKENFPALSYANDTAQVDLTSVKLTKSVVAIPPVVTTRGVSTITVSLEATLNADRVVYCSFRKQNDDTLRYVNSVVVDKATENANFTAELPLESATARYVIYAYGVRLNNDNARVVFGNMVAPRAEDIAKVIVSTSLTESDITLTETAAVESAPEP